MVKAALEETTTGIDATHAGDTSDTLADTTTTAIDDAAIAHLLEHDQLTRERMLGRAFPGFLEGDLPSSCYHNILTNPLVMNTFHKPLH